MELVEDVLTKSLTYGLEGRKRDNVYIEIGDILEKVTDGTVEEEKYYNDVDENQVRSKIIATEWYDNRYREKLELYLTLTESQVKLELKAQLIVTYDTSGWRNSLWYYGYLSLFHKFMSLKNEDQYEEWVEDKVDRIDRRLKDHLET
jgi:hypothetical protein